MTAPTYALAAFLGLIGAAVIGMGVVVRTDGGTVAGIVVGAAVASTGVTLALDVVRTRAPDRLSDRTIDRLTRDR
jgi:hypothetical protein